MQPIRYVRWAWLSLAVTASVPVSSVTTPPGGVKIGQPAPDFTLTLVDGTRITRDQLRGKVVVLNFWATWCVPCRHELPTLDAYYNIRTNAGLRVYAMTTEDSLPLHTLRKLFAAMHIPAVRKITGRYDETKAVPTNYVIDRAGVVRYAGAGAFDLDTLNDVLVPLLREAPPPGTSAT